LPYRLGRRTSRLGKNSPDSIVTPQNHSRLGEMLLLGRIIQKTTTSTALNPYIALPNNQTIKTENNNFFYYLAWAEIH